MLTGGLQECPELEPTGRSVYKNVPPEDAIAHWRKKFNIYDDYFPVKSVRVSETVASFLIRHHLAKEVTIPDPPRPFAPPPLNKPGDTPL